MKRWFRSQRGNVLLFTTALALPLMLIFAGLGNDLAYLGVVDNELQRTVDSGALAGAAKLGFDDTVFDTARQFAQDFGKANPNRLSSGPTVTLTYTAANNASDDIVLGVWDSREPPATRFRPSLDGDEVNAVRCQTFSQNLTIPTSFLRLLGLASLPVAAQATAVSGPPQNLSSDQCLFPVAIPACEFYNTATGTWTSKGCGSASATMTPAGTDGGGWAMLDLNNKGDYTSTPPASYTLQKINDAYASCNGAAFPAGTIIGLQDGEDALLYNVPFGRWKAWQNDPTKFNIGLGQCDSQGCRGLFVDRYNNSPAYTIKDTNDNTTYVGKAWPVWVPVVNAGCPNPQFNQPTVVLTWASIKIVQIINGGTCVVNNPWQPNNWDAKCVQYPNQPTNPSLNEIHFFFDCQETQSVPVTFPAPRTALATRVRLVQ
jgi:hypothetical protein